MTATSTKAAASAAFPADDYALPEWITAGHASRGPRVGDEVWDLHEFLPRTQRERRVIFTDFTPGLQRQTAQEYLYWRMRLRINGQRKPMKPTWLRRRSAACSGRWKPWPKWVPRDFRTSSATTWRPS